MRASIEASFSAAGFRLSRTPFAKLTEMVLFLAANLFDVNWVRWDTINERGYRLICIMNRKQEIVLWAGMIVIQLMIFFPPIGRLQVVSNGVEGAPESSTMTGWTRGYGIIIRDYNNIRFGLLAAQLFIAAAGTVVLIYTLREKEPNDYGH